MKRTFAALTAALLSSAFAAPITLTILHTDDLHGHLEPATVGRGTYGGYARQMTLVKQFEKTDPNVLVLSGGDTFQGTLYYNVYNGLADLSFMNAMGYDGMAVGNHEFDNGPAPLGVFARNANFPLLAANIDVSAEPALKDVIKPHAVLTVRGEKIGLIGAITPDLPLISTPGPNVKMLELTASLNNSVKALQEQGVNKIILLSHLGYTLEQEVATTVPGIDVIVGGHSHTLLGTFNNPDFPPSEGPYPTVKQNPDGNRTLIVAAWEWGKVLGRIKVTFDNEGRVSTWRDAQPIVVDATVPEDPQGKSMIAAFNVPLNALKAQVVGTAAAALNGSREIVRKRESTMANVIADATLEAGKAGGAVIGLVNGGGVRASIDAGPITYEEAITVQPFGNTLQLLDLTGAEIKAALEHGVATWSESRGQFLHVSKGVSYTFDLARPAGQRVTSVTLNGQPLDMNATYRVAVNAFTAKGGDGFTVLANAKGRRIDSGALDLDVLVNYLKANPNLNVQNEGRIVIVNEPK